jgi:malate synthase
VTQDLVRSTLAEVAGTLAEHADEAAAERLAAARQIVEDTCLVPDWPQFFTGYAYEHFLVQQGMVAA